MKKNVPLIGFLIGLLLPVLGFFIMSRIWGSGMRFAFFLERVRSDHKILARVLTMSLLINLAPFLYFKTKRLDYSMNGVVVATMLYAVLIVLLMFVW
jgi:hypothetical protein